MSAINEEKLHNPWNERNRMISPEEIHKILRRYGVYESMRNTNLFQRACVHRS